MSMRLVNLKTNVLGVLKPFEEYQFHKWPSKRPHVITTELHATLS